MRLIQQLARDSHHCVTDSLNCMYLDKPAGHALMLYDISHTCSCIKLLQFNSGENTPSKTSFADDIELDLSTVKPKGITPGAVVSEAI